MPAVISRRGDSEGPRLSIGAVNELSAFLTILEIGGFITSHKVSMKHSLEGDVTLRLWCERPGIGKTYGECRVPIELAENREWRQIAERLNARNLIIPILLRPEIDVVRLLGVLSDGAMN